ncbi:endo-1,4-beta-xylanase [Verticillium dahliae VdLs.17]|uniref:Endo-1,4-beta-xylanase n=1 Tax=Verticillium dahliae (strain VdLs.17 / ATCC MYA-4575 / FGSC 10137) TaxID=498257 RepID=G2X0M9_VERDV|nr:endo-1,4-beta-xylanase [Verticillium dahliae VdLs.17]EGY22370.1 endo-1,4-beta-xylanase [Verticillium dahliae VdLs.17]
MVYFTREGTANGEQIYMAVSNNNNPGSWTTVNNGQPVLSSTVGMKGVRDPSIIRSQDGKKYWIIATDLRVYPRGWDVGDDYTSNGSKGLVVWESSNLRTWSASQLRIMPYGILQPAAGEGLFIMRSFTTDFVSFTLPRSGSRAPAWTPPSSATHRRPYSTASAKNGPNNLVEQARASTLNGPWTVIRNEIGQGLPAGEGPLVFRDNITPSKWHMLIDDYTRGRGYQPFETSNIATANWSPASLTLPRSARHCYVIGITAAERNCIVGTGTCTAGSGTPSPPTTPSPPASPPPSGSGSCAAAWAQCGGQGWTGATCCQSGTTCKAQNQWYSQCT